MTAWAGEVGDDPILANRVPVSNGQAITVSGYAAADHPNDVIWEIFDAARVLKSVSRSFTSPARTMTWTAPKIAVIGRATARGMLQTILTTGFFKGMTDSQGTFIVYP